MIMLLRLPVIYVAFAAASQCRLVAPSHARAKSQPTSTSTTATSTSVGTTTSSASGSVASATLAAFDYGKTPIRGVNLGGWFVLEPWITPSIFENTGNTSIVDEYTLGQSQNNETTVAILTKHWDTWITEDDFAAIAAAGLNHVRIPIGYWSVPITSADTNHSTDITPYIPGAWPFFLRALGWAQTHGIYVIVDIHCGPGSQNGYDNSGHRTTPKWALDPENVARTVDLVAFIAREGGDGISILELLNEAAGWAGSDWAAVIRQFWLDGYHAVRNAVGGRMKVMIGDAFLGVNSWTNFMTYGSNYQGVYMDWHMYQVFSKQELARSFDEHISYACSLIPGFSNYSSQNLWAVSGEWSTAPTDCAKWLNGRGVGARWDGTWSDPSIYFGSCDNYTGSYTGFSADYKAFLRKYWEVQVAVGEAAIGWVYWCWKNEQADEWSYQMGLKGGWIPQDPSNRLYPDICSS